MTKQKNKIILKLLRPQQQKVRMYGAWIALCIGMLMLFTAVLTWQNFNELLSSKSKDTMAAYVVIGKKITNNYATATGATPFFNEQEVASLQTIKGVQSVGKVTANNFPVAASIGGQGGFYSEMFLSAVENEYLDIQPDDWQWRNGQPTLPIIMSNDFLNMYNYGFALSQGLPQLSQRSIQSIPIQINIAGGQEKYRAQIVGFTDRISSILVPQSFMSAMNQKYNSLLASSASRLIVKIDDPSDPAFVRFLKEKDYTTNEEQLRWNRIRNIVQAIVSSIGGIALIVVTMSVLSFILFIEITVQRAATHIRLMRQLGFATTALRQVLFRFFVPWVGTAILFAALIAIAIQAGMVKWLSGIELQIGYSALWHVGFAFLIVMMLLFTLLYKSITNTLKKL